MLRRALVGVIRLYQVGISAWTPASCRFTPTCSAYAIEALNRHGAARGSWLTIRRLMRCHPWGGYGYDPVPLVWGMGNEGHAALEGGIEGREDESRQRAKASE